MSSKKEDRFHIETIKEIAEELNLDRRVVDLVATHPFLFLSRVMRNPKNLRPVRLRYFGIFAIIAGREKK
jgi:hypothetical protein